MPTDGTRPERCYMPPKLALDEPSTDSYQILARMEILPVGNTMLPYPFESPHHNPQAAFGRLGRIQHAPELVYLYDIGNTGTPVADHR